MKKFKEFYAGGLDNSLESSSFHKDELERAKKD